MSKKIARGSLYALGMAILTAQAAEPPASLDKGEGRSILSPGRAISSVARRIKIMTGSPSLKKRADVR
jgi:hypothetical protein